ncbi:MAG: competence/damage-inducible protein A [Actinobacteria bacterium]|nr:competence/damage-inducible protein A [Actinomycetota bacterium]
MRVEVVAIGTELLLGQVVNTNAAWLGEELAAAGMDANYQSVVGDNHDRMVLAMRTALARNDAVIVCGGLGPTQDDITREAIATVMNVALKRDKEVLERIRNRFRSASREMPRSNERQADVPEGASVIGQTIGTAPGLICPIGHKVLYAVPGVPAELKEMVSRAVIADLKARAASRGEQAAIVSRTLRTWGLSESALGEKVAGRVHELDRAGGNPTIAFLASGVEGIKIRVTAKGPTHKAATEIVEAEEEELRAVLGEVVFGIDDETMEHAAGKLLLENGLTLAVAESVTGGLVSSRLVNVPGASRWFRGGLVAYDSEVKYSLLGLAEGPVVTQSAALAMAAGVRDLLHSDIGLGITGVAGPQGQEGQAPGTVHIGLVGIPAKGSPGGSLGLERQGEVLTLRLPGDRQQVRQLAAISMVDLLRRRLLAIAAGNGG